MRRGSGQPAELAPQIELLRKIGDTLGVLGLGELRGLIQGRTRLGIWKDRLMATPTRFVEAYIASQQVIVG